MKVIKRDGRAVEYERKKIETAIEKANNEVREKEKATKEEIKNIINYIEELGKKRILVEDIQDIIERKLMEIGKFNLAKKYIVYRYTRALIRKQSTTDESILSLIKNSNKNELNENSNKNAILASTQRDLIAGEVSKDLTKRMLLPDKIAKAHEEGILYFHNSDYFLQPIHNSSLINIQDMLDNGTVINGKLIETPKRFGVACTVMTQIIASVASSQYGSQSVNIKHLGKYLRKSKEKFKRELDKLNENQSISKEILDEILEKRLKEELVSGVQTIQYQINTLMTTTGKTPLVTLFLNLEEDDKYVEENAMIIEEILKQRYQGIKNENGEYITPEFPKLVYVLNENNSLKERKYDYLTKLAVECSSRRGCPYYISAKKMKEKNEGNVFSPIDNRNFLIPWKDEKGNYKFEGRFNQGIVSINLPQIGIIAGQDEEKFFELLDERLEICKEALMCKHYALLGTSADVSPIHWRYGGIARLEKGEKIDRLLKNGYSTISLQYVGVCEAGIAVKGETCTKKERKDFISKVIKHLKEAVEKWKKETGLGFVLYSTPSKCVSSRFARIDKEKFGIIEGITDKGYYTNSCEECELEASEENIKYIYANMLYAEFETQK